MGALQGQRAKKGVSRLAELMMDYDVGVNRGALSPGHRGDGLWLRQIPGVPAFRPGFLVIEIARTNRLKGRDEEDFIRDLHRENAIFVTSDAKGKVEERPTRSSTPWA